MAERCKHDLRFHLMGAKNGCCACALEEQLTRANHESAEHHLYATEYQNARGRIAELEAENARLRESLAVARRIIADIKGEAVAREVSGG